MKETEKREYTLNPLHYIAYSFFITILFSFIIILCLPYPYIPSQAYSFPFLEDFLTTKFTPKELSLYNGSDPNLPIYLSIKGKIFDVSNGDGPKFYGEGKMYNIFAGRDNSISYINGCFDIETCIDNSIHWSDLSGEDDRILEEWITFYEKHKDYFRVGTLYMPQDQYLEYQE
eukprot:TRINITY_DN443_c1_g9_i1.p1 TRINITY_DN443_c1_g9~~TRINITY_DN443_c1_g9_i1.p1  ORF type:complete len:173 (+),score=26.67 TRINITY_DN443_c1_g9_i1:704-1222(+)